MAACSLDDALLELAAAAQPATSGRSALPTRCRERLADAVTHILEIGRLQGLANAPTPTRDQALEIFKTALALAGRAGVPRAELVQAFNDDDAGDAGRRDFQ